MLWSGRNDNFAILTFDGLLFFLGMIFISYESVLPVFLVRLGAPRLAIAVVPVAIALGINLPSIMVARMVERAPRKRRIVLTYGLGQRLPWAIVAVAIPFLALSRPGWLIAIVLLGVLVATASAGIVIPAFFHIMSVTIPVERRGRLFAVRSVVSYLAGIGGGFLVSLVLEQVRFPENYSILYAAGTRRLAPLYDLVSTIAWPELSTRLAMNIGHGKNVNDVNPAHFKRLAEECGLGWPRVRERIGNLVGRAMDAMQDDALTAEFASPDMAMQLTERVQSRCERMEGRNV